MLKQRARFVAAGLRLVDMTVLAVAFPIAYFVRDRLILDRPTGGLYPLATYWPLLAASLLVWQPSSWLANVYGAYRTRGLGAEIGRIGRALVLLGVVTAATQFALKQDVSRLFFGLYYAVAFALLGASRTAIRLVAQAARRRGYNTRTFAVVGSGLMSEEVVEAISAHREWGYVFAGHVLEDGGAEPAGRRILGRLSALPEILERHVIDEMVFAVPRERLEVIERAVLLCEEQGVSVRVILDLFPARASRMTLEELDGLPVLSMTSVPSDTAPLVGKRVFDVVVSALVLLLCAPLLLLVALLIRIDSPGPVLFRQRRIGLHGRRFWLYKFRSMVPGAARQLSSLRHRNEMSGPVFKIRDDPRVTRVGRWLRKTSLDELPQFWNVLKGEMSVVGPRPPIPSEVKQYERWHRKRLAVKPGITCTWQISGRNEVEFDRWMQLDLHYVENWSLWHDLKIVLLTIPAVILGRGAR
jgi:exopolysaccharide biosynthesis polyprenyl glycosylphosphotransferase